MPDFLEQQRRQIAARLQELKPLVEEYTHLERVAEALKGVGREVRSTASGRRRSTNGRRRTTARRTTARGRTAAAASRGRSTATRRRRTATASRGRATGTRRRTATTTTGRRRGRPRGSGTRAAQALELVKSQPGITIPELAKRMGIKQNYLYRVLPGLQSDGKVRKQGRGWHPR
ncbi:MAG TPA: hypothetical protein VGY97_05690 [Solirubrobacteraceae bacterium]|nr:hypothetical protein [Solirubrobacteraceae bacterium]